MKKITFICIIALLASLLTLTVACNDEVVLRFVSNGEQIASVKAKAGEDISERLPADPERTNFVFEGWYLNEQGTGEKQTLPQTMPTKDATYYAKWTEVDLSNIFTLTLDANGGGTLENTTYNLTGGTKLKQFLEDKTPQVIDGVTFVGWYLGKSPITENSTINYSMTLTARYTTHFTVKLYEMDANGAYHESSAQPITSTAYFGEPFDCSEYVDVPQHFELDASATGSKLTTDSLGVGEQFNAYIARQKHYVEFRANPLNGVSVSGSGIRQVYFYYGQTVQIDDFAFALSRPDRLVGWSQTSDGEVYKKFGESFVLDGNVTLFAVWQQAYVDMFGGRDVMYLSVDKEDVAYLSRSHSDGDITGSYNPVTGAFSFRLGSDTILDGRISGNYFFYYFDAMEKSYNDVDGTDDTLAIGQHGRTVYTHKGEQLDGYYSIDTETGYFRFESETENFLFNLLERTSDGEVLFRRQHLDEVGNYVTTNGCVISLDGMGGLTYRFNLDNYMYEMAGVPVLEIKGYYEWQEENQHFLAYTRDATSILFELVFYIDRDAEIPPVTGFDDLEINGVIVRDDGTRGSYFDKFESTTDELYLDGFGKGTFGDIDGSYEIFTWRYVYEGEDGDEFDNYILVRMKGEDGNIYYFRLDNSYSDFEIDRVISSDDVRQDYDVGRFDIDRIYTLGTWFNIGFLYIFENGDAELWTYYAETNTHENVYILYAELISSVTRLQDGSYIFNEKVNEDTGEEYGNEFYFNLQEDIITQVYPQEHDAVTVDDDLVLDRTMGQAYYKGDVISYGYSLGYIDYYVFVVDGQNREYVRIVNGAQETFVRITEQDWLDIMYSGDIEQNEYSGRLLFVNDAVYLGLLLDNGIYRYVGVGQSSSAGEGSDEFDFVLSSFIDEFTRAELAEYADFRYKKVTEDGRNYFVQQEQSPEEFDNLRSDGYGNYLFTGENDEEIRGTVAAVVGDIILFVDTDGNPCIFAIDGNKVVNVTESDDTGFFYEMDANALISLDRYLVLDGLGNVTLYEVDMFGEMYEPQRAKYTRTQNWSPEYLEYDIQPALQSLGNISTVLSRVLLGVRQVSETQLLPLYQSQIDHRTGDYSVSGGGRITSAGYPAEPATYTASNGTKYSGNMYVGRFNTGTADHSFINDPTGNYVHFWVGSNNVLTSTHFYFEIVGGRLVELTLPYGEYAFYDGEKVITTKRIILNGRGGATLRDSTDNSSAEGTYLYNEQTDSYEFVTPLNRLVFRLGYDSSEEDLITYVYYTYNENEDRLYRNPEDWSCLDLDGFGNATCVDRYGRVYEGYVVMFAEGYGYFGSSGLSRLFAYDNEKGTFAFVDHSEHVATYYSAQLASFILGEALLTVDGVDYYYIVESETITAYPVNGDEAQTFALPSDKVYNLGNVSYYRYDGGAITFTDDEFSVPLTLAFTPNGAVFGTQATFNGESNGFTINVGYGVDGVTVNLRYNSGQMDSATEEYAVQLHFEGGNNTFTITPGGYHGEYVDSVNSNSGITLDARTIGPFLVGEGTVVYNFDYITDSADQPFGGTSTYSQLKMGSGNDFNYGYPLIADFTGTDGIVYSFEFFLDNAQPKTLILSSVTVKKTFDVNGLSVTVTQLWQSGRSYVGNKRYDIVGLSIPENGVTTTIFQSAIEEGGKAVLVHQTLNMTTGVYTYNAYVFVVSYDKQFVSGLTEEGKYNYAEANQGGDYMVRFLYTNDQGTFNVRYVLTFTIGTSLQQATFTQKGDNAFEIDVEGTVYLATIRRVGSEFTLEVKPQ